jgi:oligopeptide/dipeptide ABC transporter ATP-binding protein
VNSAPASSDSRSPAARPPVSGELHRAALLEIAKLRVTLTGERPRGALIHDVSLHVAAGEAVGLVGESGAGKSMTIRAILRMLPPGVRAEGAIRFLGRDLADLDERELREYRADDVGVVFQDPRAHVNPVRRVGDFLTEPLIRLRRMSAAEARRSVDAILREIGIEDGAWRFRQYPHELSGGLLQRIMIASVVAMEPKLILADEPTTALDVTTQSDVMAIIAELQRTRNMSLLLVTHDLELAAAVCDRIAVMYAGSIVEEGPADAIIHRPSHPYTLGLTASRPAVAKPGERLHVIPGRPLSALDVERGCPFAPRCRFAQESCSTEKPSLRSFAEGRVACLRAESIPRPLTTNHRAGSELV